MSQGAMLISALVVMGLVVLVTVGMVAPSAPSGDDGITAAELSAIMSATGAQTTATGALKNKCEGGQTQTFDPNVYDRENVNTAFTDPHLYRKVGSYMWTAGTEGTALTTLEVGNNYEFVLGISKSDFINESYGPYLRYDNIPCVVNLDDVESADNEPETGLTWTFYNNDNNAEYQALTAGLNSKKVYPRVAATSKNYFGNPYLQTYKDAGVLGVEYTQRKIDFPNVLVLEMNLTGIDKINKVTVDGLSGKLTMDENGKYERAQVLTSMELKSVGCPSGTRHTPVTTDTNYCFEFPVIGDEDLKITIDIDADDTIAHISDDTAYLFAAGLFLDDDGVLQMGIETDQNADVANDASDSVALDWSA